jgi:predicted nucleic acid-binding Zn ribbon protein
MPLYEYETIGEKPERFEVLQSLRDKPLTSHPETGKPVRKVFSCCSVKGDKPSPHPTGCNCCQHSSQ